MNRIESAGGEETAVGQGPSDYGEAFPNSRKVYLEAQNGVRVPMREISLPGGEPSLLVSDTSGPRGHDVREGLPPVRLPWIQARNVRETGRTPLGDGGSQVAAAHAADLAKGHPRAQEWDDALSRARFHARHGCRAVRLALRRSGCPFYPAPPALTSGSGRHPANPMGTRWQELCPGRARRSSAGTPH